MDGGTCVLMADFVSRGLRGVSCEVAGWRWVMCLQRAVCGQVICGLDVDQRCRGLKSGLVKLVGGSVDSWER